MHTEPTLEKLKALRSLRWLRLDALAADWLAQRTRALFAPSSERRATPVADQPAASPAPPRGHGPRAQPALPCVEVTHTLDAPDQLCPQCGGDLVPWDGQCEEAEEIDVVERSFRVVRHRRQKYRCRCGQCIDTALGPRS